MGAVDTNVLVRLLVADDPVQTKRAAAFFQARRPAWISTVVLVETVRVLMTVYRWSKTQMLAMLPRPRTAGILLSKRWSRCEERPMFILQVKPISLIVWPWSWPAPKDTCPLPRLTKPRRSYPTQLVHKVFPWWQPRGSFFLSIGETGCCQTCGICYSVTLDPGSLSE